jgi:cytidine deaminase
MFHAWAAKFRSSAAGRQVGAVIVDSDGEIVVVGCNDVPKPGGGQYWEGDDADRRDFQLRYDANDQGKHGMARDVLQRLAEAGWLREDYSHLSPNDRASTALTGDGPLRKSELDDLIEYGRIVHAEMAALITAARRGRAVRGGTIYTTTYPCHECARLIIAAGICRVCFIDPYVKSRAPSLFATMWNQLSGGDGVLVEPFEGISPRLFPRVFEMSNRSKSVEGAYEPWKEKRLLMGDEEIADSVPAQEDAAGAYLAARLAETEAAVQPIMESADESEVR